MTQEVGRRLIDGVWVTDVMDESAGGGGGSIPSPEWTLSPDGSLVVANYIDDPDNPTTYFSLTAVTREVFAAVMRVYSSLTLDDAPMVATSDNGPTCFEIDPTGDGVVNIGGSDATAALAQLADLLTAVVSTATTKRIELTDAGIGFFQTPPADRATVLPILDPSTATVEEVADKINVILAALGSTGGLGLIADGT